MKKCKVRLATVDEKEKLRNLLQFYIYDFSEFIEAHLERDGRFDDYPIDNFFNKGGYYPYLVEYKDHLAGFALVKQIEEKQKHYFIISEFFIMKKYRHAGIGREVAKRVFELHRGDWQVGQIEKNKAAQSFWLKVIDEYTDGAFKEKLDEGHRTQIFVS